MLGMDLCTMPTISQLLMDMTQSFINGIKKAETKRKIIYCRRHLYQGELHFEKQQESLNN